MTQSVVSFSTYLKKIILMILCSILCIYPTTPTYTYPTPISKIHQIQNSATLTSKVQHCLYATLLMAAGCFTIYGGVYAYKYLATYQSLPKIIQVIPHSSNSVLDGAPGAHEAKKQLAIIVDDIQTAEKKAANEHIIKQYTLYGISPDKLHIAQALAANLQYPLIIIDGNKINNLHLHDKLFSQELEKKLRDKQKCIIVVQSSHCLHKQTFDDLHTCIIEKSKKLQSLILIHILKTPECCHSILASKNIHIALQALDRRELLAHYLQDYIYDPNINLDKLAAVTQTFTCTDLKELIQHSAVYANKESDNRITDTHIIQALHDIVAEESEGTTDDHYTQEEKKRFAYHEAGHALLSILCIHSTLKVYYVTIAPLGKTAGYNLFYKHNAAATNSIDGENKEDIQILLAGMAAEDIQYNTVSGSSSSDLKKAKKIASLLTKSTAQSILPEQYNITKTLLLQHKDKLDILAQALFERETLHAHEIYELIGMPEPEFKLETSSIDLSKQN